MSKTFAPQPITHKEIQSLPYMIQLICIFMLFQNSEADRCASLSDCGTLAKPICLSNLCSPCQTDSDCTRIDPTAICDTSGSPAKCVPGCPSATCSNPKFMICNIGPNLCQPCTVHADCDPDFYWGCYTGICAECTSSAHCVGNPKGPHCFGYQCKRCNPANNVGCTKVTPRCIGDEYGGGSCVGCISDADCAAWSTTYSYCRGDGQCVMPPCTTDSDCASVTNRAACHPTLQYCVNCTSDAYCGPGKPFCNVPASTCVQCKVDSDCPTNWNCTATFTCKPPCQTDAECPTMPLAKCDTSLAGGTCVACDSTTQCSRFVYGSTTGVCNSGICSVCTANTDCYIRTSPKCYSNRYCSTCANDADCTHHAPAYPHCFAGTCSECAIDAHCSGGYHCSPSGTCVQCLDNTHCTIATPRCSRLTYTCGGCYKDKDCAYFNVGLDYCNRATGICQNCVVQTHCQDPTASKCSATVCAGCNSDQDCNHIVGAKRCDILSHTCKICVSNAQCLTQTASKCSPTGCVPCTNDGECSQFNKDQFCEDSICIPLRVIINGVPPYISLAVPTTLNAVVSSTDDNYTCEWFVYPPGVEYVSFDDVLTIKSFTESRINTFPTNITVQVLVTTNTGNSITKNVTIPVNLPPKNGMILATNPLSIYASSNIQTTGWIDPEFDTPLLYSFEYVNGIVTTAYGPKWIPLSAGYISSPGITYLFNLGLESQDYNITLIVWAKDTRGAVNYTLSYNRTPPPSLDELINLLNTQNLEDILQILIDSTRAIESGFLKYASGCPTCSGHGTCSTTNCTCNTGYTLSDCSVSTDDMTKLIELKKKSFSTIEQFLTGNPTNKTTLKKISILIGVSETHVKLTPSDTAEAGLTTFQKHLKYMENNPLLADSTVVNETNVAYDDILNHLTDPCDPSSTISKSIVDATPGIIDQLTFFLLQNAVPDSPPKIVEYENFALLAQRVRVSSLPNKEFAINSSTPVMVFPPSGITPVPVVSVVDIQYFYFNPKITTCFGNSMMSYGFGVKKTGTTQDQNYTNAQPFTVKVPVKAGEDFKCAEGCEKETVNREGGGIFATCVCADLNSFKSSAVASFISNSNIGKLANAGVLLSYDFIGSPVVWLIVCINVLTFHLGKWAYYKDKNEHNNAIYNANANRSKKILLYLQYAHALFGIFFITHKRFSRLSRVFLFNFKLMGYLAISAIFRQSVDKNQGIVSKIMLMLVPIITLSPVLSILMWLFTSPPKKNYNPSWARTKKIIAISLTILGDLGFIYMVLVISANNSTKGQQVINEWVYQFFITFGLENGLIQPLKISVQVCLLGIVQSSKNAFIKKYGKRIISLDVQRVAYTFLKYKAITYDRTMADLKVKEGLTNNPLDQPEVDESSAELEVQKEPSIAS